MVKMENLVKNKTCTKCNIILPAIVGNFYKDNQKKDGLSSSCAECCKKTRSKTYKEIISPREKNKRKESKELYLNSEEYKLFLIESKKKDKIRKKKWADKNRDLINEKARSKPRKKPSPDKIKQYKKKDYDKIMNDPYKKFIHYARVRIYDCFKEKKNFSIKGVIHFTHDDFVIHISSLFKDNMSWDNYGKNGWHIDHIRPLASFDLNNEKDLNEAFSLQNLQPLWSSDNCSKGSLYNGIRYKKSLLRSNC